MNAPARRMWELLELERGAACRADVEALEALQREKREIMDRLGEQGIEEAERDAMVETAKENVDLIRHLTAMLAALAGVQSSTYGRAGAAREDANAGLLRGRG